MVTKKTREAFPPSVSLAGGGDLVAVNAAGTIVALLPYSEKGKVVIVEEGKKPRRIVLQYCSSLFEPRDPRYNRLKGLAFHGDHVAAVFDDNGDDGPGVCTYDLEGAPVSDPVFFLPDAERKKRAKGGQSSSGTATMPQHIVVSPDGDIFALRLYEELLVWKSGGPVGKPERFPISFQETDDLVLNGARTHLVWRNRANDDLVQQELATGKRSALPLKNTKKDERYVGTLYGGGPMLTTYGVAIDDDGKLLPRLDGNNVKYAVQTTEGVVVLHDNGAVRVIDAASKTTATVAGKLKDLTSKCFAAAGGKRIVAGHRKGAFILPWP